MCVFLIRLISVWYKYEIIFSYHYLKSYCVELLFSVIFSHIIQFSSILFFIFWPCCAAYRILVPQPGVEPVPCELGVQSLNHWTSQKVTPVIFDLFSLIFQAQTIYILSTFHPLESCTDILTIWGRDGEWFWFWDTCFNFFIQSLLPICVREKKIWYYILMIHIYWTMKILPHICLLKDFIF